MNALTTRTQGRQTASLSGRRTAAPAPNVLRKTPVSLTRQRIRVNFTDPEKSQNKATKDSNNTKTEPSGLGNKVDKVIEELKKTGMTSNKAKEVLKAWGAAGVSDPEALRKLLVSRTLAPIPTLALQSLLDATASFGGFYIGGLVSEANFPFKILVELVGYFIGCYYFVQALLELTVIGGLLFSSYKYGTSSGALLTAVQSMAGPATGLGVVDRANRVVNILKVVSALESVSDLLREEFASPPKNDSMRNLGAYLTLSHARESAGFKPEAYGLTEAEAGKIAFAFSTYDVNSNFKLEPSELRSLCSSLGKELDGDEVKEAVKLLDSNNNGYIEFNEFVDWWLKKTGKAPAGAAQQAQKAK